MKKYFRYIFSLVGILIFGWLAYKIGLDQIRIHLAKVGWWLIPLFLITVLWYLAYTYAWYLFLKPFGGKVSFWELFKIKIIGETLNTVTPINFIGGDPARAYLLKHKLPMTGAAASVVVDRTLHSVATLITILVGMGAALVQLRFLPKNIKYGLPIILAIASGFVIFILIHQHKGLFTFIAAAARKLKIKKNFSTKTLDKFEEVDGHIQDFYIRNRLGFIFALSLHLFGRFLGIVEIYIIGHVLNSRFSFTTALLLGAAAPILNFMFAFIPGAIGVIEGSYSAILYSLKFSPAIGMTIQIIRRVRSMIWILIGFLFLGTQKRKLLNEAENADSE